MKRIGLIVNRNKDLEYDHTRYIIEKLSEKGFHPVVCPETAKIIGLEPPVNLDSVFEKADLIICMGGDGTFLKAARKAYLHDKPVLGINKGSVGFLAEVEIKDIELAIEKISCGNLEVMPRMVLDVSIIRHGKKVFNNIAINDAVVSRMAMSRILRTVVTLDDKFVDCFPGDGVIVSTPTGSTGYSLSAGGPIVQPDMRLMIISPICPHLLYSRSFIASESHTVKISLGDDQDVDAMLTLDGQEGVALKQGDVVVVKESGKDVLFASVSHLNFYDVLRSKIHYKTE